MNSIPASVQLLGTPGPNGTFVGVTTAGLFSQAIDPSQHKSGMTVAVIGNGTITDGTVIIEEGYSAGSPMSYGGQYSTIYTVTASDVSGGKQKAIHIAPGSMFPLRVRIGDAIVGGGGISAVLRYS
jgi:hypothetical protein